MQASLRHSRGFRLGFALGGVLLCLAIGIAVPVASAETAPGDAYRRADADRVRQDARDILNQPRFVDEPSVFERFSQWLDRQLGGLDLSWADELGPFLGIAAYMALAVIAVVLVLLIAYVVLTLMGWRHKAAPEEKSGGPLIEAPESPDKLEVLSRQAAADGRWREALGLLMLALLRRLDSHEIVSFHESKTNGEYVREYPQSHPTRPLFKAFVRDYDAAMYASKIPREKAYHDLDRQYSEVRRRAVPIR